MDTIPHQNSSLPKDHLWKSIVLKYQKSSLAAAWVQILNTMVPYALLWVAMYYTQKISFWLTLPLALLAGAFLVRIFIIFHDCTHGSFFKSPLANQIFGFFTGLLTFTSFHHWKWEHSLHHAHAGDLDRRGIGDVWTMTVQEYLKASRWERFSYQIVRNPFVLFALVPLGLFLFVNRFPSAKAKLKERIWLHLTNVSLLVACYGFSLIFNLSSYLWIQLVILWVASTAGVWLFYVQHQFEDVYWDNNEEWDYKKAALEGSSFYKLPRILQWFSGNIGFHHIHHLSPRIPNYRLEEAHNSEEIFKEIDPLTWKKSLKSLTFRLWDEKTRKLVGYRGAKNSAS